MCYLLYLMFRCDFDVMENLKGSWDLNTPLVKILQGDCYPPMISSACWCHLASYSDSSARCAPAGTLPAFKIASVGFASLVSRAWCTLGTGNEFATATQANDDAGPLRHGRRTIRKIRRQELLRRSPDPTIIRHRVTSRSQGWMDAHG